LTATVRDTLGAIVAGTVTWSSSNTGVITVSGGLVNGISVGSATVQASYGGVTAAAVVSVVTVAVATVQVSPPTDTIQQGATIQLAATPRDSGGVPLTGRVIAWSTNNAGVATVSSSGLVRGMTGGIATISAVSEGQTGTSVTTVVSVPVATVTVAPASATVQLGRTQQLTATTRDAANGVLTGRVITWLSSDTSIARVSTSGLVTARAIGGPVTITATSEGQSGTSSITIVPVPVATVQVSPTTASVALGATVQLTATTRDANGAALTGRTIVWTTSDSTIASVTATGLVRGVATGGPVTITATSEGKTGSATVNVTGAAATLVRVVLLPDTVTLLAGGSRQFSASGKMSDSSVAAISVTYSAAGGTITQLGNYVAGQTPGTYLVIARAQGYTLADTSRVGILAAPPPGSYTLAAGNDWQAYSSTTALRAAGLFDNNSLISLESDPVFGQVARITQPANCSPGAGGVSPSHAAGFTPMDKTWVRMRMRLSPGWTDVGPEPAGHGNAYKIAFILWQGTYERFNLGTISNGYSFGVSYGNVTMSQSQVSGATNWHGLALTAERTGAEWWEYILYHEKFSSTTGRWRIWKRQLTQGMQTANLPFVFDGYDMVATSGTIPQATRFVLGANKNKCTPTTQYIYWGPYEVVDGSRYPNPFGVGP
jgi:uncharacterized protein YjdB